MSVGADLYVVYDTDPLGVSRGTMRWLQVSRGGPIASDQGPRVDGTGPANPFYPTGVSVSVNGTRVGNFLPAFDAPLVELNFQFTAQAFLARDTGTKDDSGREIVEVFGRVSYGWQVRS
ncbi:MAG TPA: hypothetical protein VFU98_19535 [Microlunatus sp.]|nr:hypothetical protein [Microlunatus sp.]